MPLQDSQSIIFCFKLTGTHISSPPLVQAAYPSQNLKFITFFSIFTSPLQTGKRLRTNSTLFFCAWARQLACPRMPNPVTSVQAPILYFCIILAPTTLSVAICCYALKQASTSYDSVAYVSIFYLFSLFVFNHCMALMANLVPNGFVRIMTSPGLAQLGITQPPSSTTAIAHPPIIGQALQTV